MVNDELHKYLILDQLQTIEISFIFNQLLSSFGVQIQFYFDNNCKIIAHLQN